MSWDLKAFALLLASYADPDGTKIYPGEDRLTVVTGKSRSTVQRHLRVLRELGLIEVAQRGSRKNGQPDEYRLTLAVDARLKISSPEEHAEAVTAIKQARSEGLRPLRPNETAVATLEPQACDEETALYRWFDTDDILLYAGITDRLYGRLQEHDKTSPWMQFAVRSTIERFPSRPAAVKAEREAITGEHPVFNKAHNDTPEARLRAVEYLVSHGRYDLLTPAISRG
jgi:DNA-binding transcriptional ArsR family regulator